MQFADARATVVLTVATIVASAILLLTGNVGEAAINAGFIPLRVAGTIAGTVPVDHAFAVPAWATPLSATFIHAGLAHIAFNLVMLVYCGQQTERAIGTPAFVVLYVVGAYAAALGQYLVDPGSAAPMIGASGAISAVVAAYALLYGERRTQAIGPIPAGVVHVAWLAAAWIGIQLLIGVVGFGGGAPIAIGAHIGGFIAGLILARPLLLWRYRAA